MKTQGNIQNRGALPALFLLIVTAAALGGGVAWAAPEGSPWGANYFPNTPLVTQDGKKVRFYDDLIKDKVVAINFIFTRCTNVCPAETAALRQVQKLLGDRVGKDIFFYSISIDPKGDTPQTLKAYSQKFKTGPGWTFLAGKKADVTLLRKKLGLYREETGQAKLASHSTSFLVGNEATGQWIRRSPFDEPKALARLLGERLPDILVAKAGKTSYAQAKASPRFSRGEELFRSRCDSCHTMGTEDALGPGLSGVVQKRDRAWLARWLKQPDRLLAEKDPIATALYDRYQKLAMPNLKLSDADVEALIGYMEVTR